MKCEDTMYQARALDRCNNFSMIFIVSSYHKNASNIIKTTFYITFYNLVHSLCTKARLTNSVT